MLDALPDNIRCMPRTTLDIDAAVLEALKRRQRQERKPLGRLVSELLTEALATGPTKPVRPLAWRLRPMEARIDLEDKEAVRAVLDER